MKRFYKTAGVVEAETGFAVTLDDKPMRTPNKARLIVPTRALAEAIAAEWQSQGETVRVSELYMTRLANTAIDRVSALRDETVATIVAYGRTDLLCHRVNSPFELAEQQRLVWQPLLDWLAHAYDAPLAVTTDIFPTAQPPASIEALRAAVGGLDTPRLTVLAEATGLTGSIVLGLALIDGRVTPDAAFEAAQLEETFQMERWGEDAEAAARRASLRIQINAAARFARLLGPEGRAGLAS